MGMVGVILFHLWISNLIGHSYQLVRHPASLKRLRQEILSFTEDGGMVTRAQMTYFRCVLNESKPSPTLIELVQFIPIDLFSKSAIHSDTDEHSYREKDDMFTKGRRSRRGIPYARY
jgi:hypothetical protein